jgi:hypothetical protein
MKIDFKKQLEFRKFIKRLNENKSSFYTKEEVIQLETYEILLFDYFLWKRFDSYLKLVRNFLHCQISGNKFAKEFITLRSNHISEFEELMKQLKLISLLKIPFAFLTEFNFNLAAGGFTDIIDLAESYCDAFVSDELLLKIGGLREDGDINYDEFRKGIEKTFHSILFEDRSNSIEENLGFSPINPDNSQQSYRRIVVKTGHDIIIFQRPIDSENNLSVADKKIIEDLGEDLISES